MPPLVAWLRSCHNRGSLRTLVVHFWVVMLRSNSLRSFLASLLLVTLLPACANEPKKKKSAAKSEAAATGVADVMEMRRKRIMATLPEGDEMTGDEHPWLAWVKKGVAISPANELRKAATAVENTPVAEQAEALAKWAEAARAYYQDEKLEPNEYWNTLATARRLSAGTPWEADMEFERLMFHAAELARSWTLFDADRRDDRVLRFFTYWKFVFDFNPKTGIYEDEVNWVCGNKLGDYCKDIPMEERPTQVQKRYYEGVIAQIEAYKQKFPTSPWNPLLDRFAVKYKEKAAKVPKFEEYPVFPGIRSTFAAPLGGNAVLTITDKGVNLMDNQLRKPEDGWKPDWAPDAKLSEDIGKLVEAVRSTTQSQYNQSNILLVTLADVPMRYLEAALRATIVGEHAKEWTSAWLVGRRRGDGSNRRAGYQISILPVAAAGDKKNHVDATPNKTVPFSFSLDKKTWKCLAWATVGKDPYEAKAFQSIVFNDGKLVHAARISGKGELIGDQAAPSDGEGGRLEAWGDAQATSIVIAVPETATYKQLLEAMNGVALRCDVEGCKVPRVQPVFLATCK